ncbi:MAG: TrkA family potassium uptake protein [Candidatus Riflebacteria bacterium]|nr:TrkA family potassium uptake protein [Candidatus Riflebacteria bacterium]
MQIAVLGLGTFGTRVAEVLTLRGIEVLAFDYDPGRVEALKDRVSRAVILDATDEKALRRAGIGQVDVAVVALGASIEANIVITAVLRRLGVGRIIARCDTPVQAAILTEVGAGRVILVEHQMAEQLAEELSAPQILSRRVLDTGHVVGDVRAPEWMVGRTLLELELRRRFSVSVVAIRRRRPAVSRTGAHYWEADLIDAPGADQRISAEDVLIIIGRDTSIRNMVVGDGGEPR